MPCPSSEKCRLPDPKWQRAARVERHCISLPEVFVLRLVWPPEPSGKKIDYVTHLLSPRLYLTRTFEMGSFEEQDTSYSRKGMLVVWVGVRV